MKSFHWTCVGFDLDGTLVDSTADLAAAVNHGLGTLGRPPLPVATIRPMIGLGALHMLEQAVAATGDAVSPAELAQAHHALSDFYAANLAVHTRPYPHLLPALDTLAAAGVTLAIATNKRQRFADDLLARLGLTDRFASVLGGDSLGPGRGKPAPDLLHAMVARCGAPAAYVGDSRFDVAAARAAGLPVIACAFDQPRAAAQALGADAVICGFDELLPALERLTP